MINFDAFVKYSKPGPRYTSYPTALEFSDEFNYDEYTKRLRNGDKNRPLSLYFHLPFCRSACYFCGCNVIYTSKSDKMGRYLDYVDKELDILSTVLDTNRKVTQMHFGGGTPTFYSASELNRLIESIKRHFKNWSDDAEISCEIDPRFLNEEQLDVLTSHGFNRVSFGVQDFDEKVQKEIHRIQPFDMTKNAVDMARAKGIISVNTDLIYGLPFQSLESFKNTLDLGLKLNPDRFAVFNYAHVPWIKKSMRKFDESTLPSPKVKLEILKYTMEFLTSNGYKMIGMDHYAKPEDELFHALRSGSLHRNFQGYTTKGGADLIGIGLTSIGEGEDYYAQNFKDMDGYEKAIDEGKLPNFKGVMLSEEDKLRKAVIMDLMANFALDIKAIETKFNIDFWEHFKNELNELEELKDFVEISPQKIKVNETGTLLIRNIAMCFDEYMIKFKGVKNSFSKTV
ncbi:oxygen-independent coproporphyrinogen III oxidase [Campylobacter hyointestinalis]|uniref:Coproporphyrinogen-III oxidase n=1 Tax=Campylobacter hyointestinalis subsp. hyointestinalis TaxID=91352 RepID=A0A855N7P6_CAMHY|nr:oxygen-independent coproporphyrinogen III oxidase [Campylobacter hyointestinalis]MBT0611325.1 oxygen-independent coproporphyrinogen III oxidase [Campylobacter hyointestinalis subsp. hyointestinalis]MDL2346312.1 oxygen-independent coproporphyrinogen III oxidase [Campylobacter hyointestinalis]MDL2348052.1 oxygen-independent coproporphyrinogen III oxidase [Campylobacter hyointestinalis]MDL2349795.1 oxygen-independent coproporphyrinogen III oxidase [Campylobacter hyointestinalis]MDM1025528.1 ox